MKKNPILLAMLVVLLVLSMALVGCDNGGGGDPDPNPNPNPSPTSSLQWPAGFTYTPGNDGSPIGTWTAAGVGNVTFYDGQYPFVSFGLSMYDLKKVEGNKITLEHFTDGDVVLCTAYTLDLTASPATLTLTGGDSSKFSDYMDVALTKN